MFNWSLLLSLRSINMKISFISLLIIKFKRNIQNLNLLMQDFDNSDLCNLFIPNIVGHATYYKTNGLI